MRLGHILQALPRRGVKLWFFIHSVCTVTEGIYLSDMVILSLARMISLEAFHISITNMLLDVYPLVGRMQFLGL